MREHDQELFFNPQGHRPRLWDGGESVEEGVFLHRSSLSLKDPGWNC